MKTEKKKTILNSLFPILVALLSILLLTRIAADSAVYDKVINSLQDKQNTVLELTAASTAASDAITLLPGDTATPLRTS